MIGFPNNISKLSSSTVLLTIFASSPYRISPPLFKKDTPNPTSTRRDCNFTSTEWIPAKFDFMHVLKESNKIQPGEVPNESKC